MSSEPRHQIPLASERVLATLNVDGSRRWIRPSPEHGAWWKRRRLVSWVLMIVFVALPFVRIMGKQAILLDLPRREFTLFGATFQPTETLLFMLGFISLLIGIFLVSALAGRVWCGWACPQTVYMEFLFRPIEQWLEGGAKGSRELDAKHAWLHPRRLLKYAIYAGLSALLGNAFLAYWVGSDRLMHWMTLSPIEHWGPFVIMAGVSALVFFDFTYFREQTCLVACPYGRLQSVLLDKQSLIVGYDTRRGEPRGRGGRDRDASLGDCVACNRCVTVCPTGIDIRDGLQMECIHCTQCMDACDSVMVKIGKPAGLIRYSSREELSGQPRRLLRPRVVVYPLVLTVTLGLFTWALARRGDTEVTLLRARGVPFTEQAGGVVSNQVRVKIANRSGEDRHYHIAMREARAGQLIVPMNPMPVPAGHMQETSVFVLMPPDAFTRGERAVTFEVRDGDRVIATLPYRLVGPEHPGTGTPAPAAGTR